MWAPCEGAGQCALTMRRAPPQLLAVFATLLLAIVARAQTLPADLPQRFECAIPKEQQPGYVIDLPTYRRTHVPDGSIAAVVGGAFPLPARKRLVPDLSA